MVAYSFKEQFIQPILESRKLQTIREIGRRRHGRSGDELQLYYGMRTKQCRLIARRRCIGVVPVELIVKPDSFTAVVDGHPLNGLELYNLAISDGFSDLDAMWRFWRENHKYQVFRGGIIKWEPGDV